MIPRGQVEREKDLRRNLKMLEGSEAATRFLGSYGKLSVKATYAYHLGSYHRWLRERKGVSMTLDQLIIDNLRCVYESAAVDVERKRRHRAWLEEYVNAVLLSRSESYRRGIVSTVRGFYEKNDSPLFGTIKVAESPVGRPAEGLKAEDIRKVLLALPLQHRTPLLCMWQSGTEISRMLNLRWGDVPAIDNGSPLKLEFFGRKRHKRPYYTFLGRDSVEALRIWRVKWAELVGRQPGPDDLVFVGKAKGGADREWLNISFRRMALGLASHGAIENGDPASWHSHMLRHSFKTEGEHAGVSSGIIEFMMGHIEGVKWVYDNRDTVHEQDFRDAYLKLEPFLSLSQTEATLKGEFEEERRSWIIEIQDLKRQVARLAG